MSECERNLRPAERTRQEETIEIRICPDGKILFHGTSEELLEIAALVCPKDPWLAKRLEIMNAARRRPTSETDAPDRAASNEIEERH